MVGALTLPVELGHSLGFNLDRASVLFRRELLRILANAGLQPEQWQALLVIRNNSADLSQQDLADLLFADKHAVSRMLFRMQRDGWIGRVRSENDARSQRVILTAKAQKCLPQLLRDVRTHFRKRLARLEDSDREQLLRLLTRLQQLLRDEQ